MMIIARENSGDAHRFSFFPFFFFFDAEARFYLTTMTWSILSLNQSLYSCCIRVDAMFARLTRYVL